MIVTILVTQSLGSDFETESKHDVSWKADWFRSLHYPYLTYVHPNSFAIVRFGRLISVLTLLVIRLSRSPRVEVHLYIFPLWRHQKHFMHD